ncbi:hypothetical protein FRC19_000880 [Serendipita sp. 401]|nr:hypothetical protein FRC19_000880 [Serendipita sp. 401]KAG9055875.1 hypothetical protein FS842_000870 [Serendipita sp. 407]
MRFQLSLAVLFFAAAGLVSSAAIPEVPKPSSISSTEVLPAQHHLTGAEAGQQVVHLARRTSPTDKSVSSNGHANLSKSHGVEHAYYQAQATHYGTAAAGYENVAEQAKKRMDKLSPSHPSHGAAKADHTHATDRATEARALEDQARRASNFHQGMELAHNQASQGDWKGAKANEDYAKSFQH